MGCREKESRLRHVEEASRRRPSWRLRRQIELSEIALLSFAACPAPQKRQDPRRALCGPGPRLFNEFRDGLPLTCWRGAGEGWAAGPFRQLASHFLPAFNSARCTPGSAHQIRTIETSY
jgi:hypothetical protein